MNNPVLSLDWSALVGSGFVAAVLLLALVERLRSTFATKDDLAAVERKLHELQQRYTEVRQAADEANATATAIQGEQKHQWELVNRQVIEPLARITDKLEDLGQTQIGQAATLAQLDKWLERVQARRRASDETHRRSA